MSTSPISTRSGSPSSSPSRRRASRTSRLGRHREGYAIAFIEPFGTLWFIYLLPIFFVVTKALAQRAAGHHLVAPRRSEVAHVHTGSMVIDEFAARFVYFYSGYVFAPYVFAFAAKRRRAALALSWLGLGDVRMLDGVPGYSALPVVSLGLGFIGALAVVTVSMLLAPRVSPCPCAMPGSTRS